MKYSIYSNMISPPKQWCESIDCFAKSNYRFYSVNGEIAAHLILNKSKTEWQFKSILSKTTFYDRKG